MSIVIGYIIIGVIVLACMEVYDAMLNGWEYEKLFLTDPAWWRVLIILALLWPVVLWQLIEQLFWSLFE